jgi:hypothetical protein
LLDINKIGLSHRTIFKDIKFDENFTFWLYFDYLAYSSYFWQIICIIWVSNKL